MDRGTEPPSRLFQDLLNLEKDFKYNVSLLKIKDTEIERCSIANRNLQETLKSKFLDSEVLKNRLGILEATLRKTQDELECEKLICQQTVAKLTENLNEMTRKLQRRVEETKSETRLKHAELEKVYARVLAQKEKDHQQNIEAVEERLQKEICSTSKTKNRLQALAEENMSLRNKIRQLESQYTSETYFYKNEFKTVQSTNANLNSEIECLKESRASVEKKFAETKLENDDLRRELCANTEKISNLIKQNKESVVENNNLKVQLQESENLYKGLILDNTQLTREKNQLESEYNTVTEIVNEYSTDSHCNVMSHSNHNVLLKQNAVLQDLVRGMRKDREKTIEENWETERRVEKLEELMKVLKKSYV